MLWPYIWSFPQLADIKQSFTWIPSLTASPSSSAMKLSTRPFISGIKVPVATPGQKWRSVLLLHHHHHHLNVHMVHKPQVSFAKASSRPPETASRISTYTNDIHIRQVDQMPATPQTKAQDLEEQIERVGYLPSCLSCSMFCFAGLFS